MKYLIVLLLISNFSFSQEWTKIELNEFASIKFPNPSDVKNNRQAKIYSTSDDVGRYIVMTKDLGDPKLKESELYGFYQDVIAGTLKTTQGELLETNEFILNGILGMEILYKTNLNSLLTDLRQKRIILINNNVISYEFITYSENKQLAAINKNKFFNSISISKVIVPKEKETNDTYKSGSKSGKIVFYVSIIVLLIGGVLLILNRNRKRNIKTK